MVGWCPPTLVHTTTRTTSTRSTTTTTTTTATATATGTTTATTTTATTRTTRTTTTTIPRAEVTYPRLGSLNIYSAIFLFVTPPFSLTPLVSRTNVPRVPFFRSSRRLALYQPVTPTDPGGLVRGGILTAGVARTPILSVPANRRVSS